MADGFLSADLWVLEYLLEQDRVQDELIKQFCDGLGQSEGLPPIIQMRLMLRVLHGNVAVITRDTLHALDCLTTATHGDASLYPPYTRLRGATPSAELYLQVKTELVLRALRPEYAEEAGAQALLDLYFQASDDMDEADRTRRAELQEAIDDPEKIPIVQERYPTATVQAALAAYVAYARQQLGPPVVKVVEADATRGVYHPCVPGINQVHVANMVAQVLANQGVGGQVLAGLAGKGRKTPKEGSRKKRKGKDSLEGDEAVAVLKDLAQGTSKLPTLGGADPLPGVLNHAGQAGHDGTSYSQAVEEAAGDPCTGGQTIFWNGTQGVSHMANEALTPEQMQMVMQLAGSPGGSDKKGARRRNGRWNEKETNLLITLVRRLGKGKWKRILEEGGNEFQNRSQVDLKDKWRNLERQNIVGPADIGPQDPNPAAPDAGDATSAPMMSHPEAALPPAPVDVGPQPDIHGDVHGAMDMMTDEHTAHLGGDAHMDVADLGSPDLSMHHEVHSHGMVVHQGMTEGMVMQHDPHDPGLAGPDGLHNPELVGVQ